MNDGIPVWLARNGEKFGPYEPDLLRQWVAEGKVARDTMAWREGMAQWLPLDQVIDVGTAAAPPPPPPFGGDLPPMSARAGRSGFDDLGRESVTDRRRALPSPPSMHWFALVLLCIVTLNIFGLVWRFIQANWVKKIDELMDQETGAFFIAVGAAHLIGKDSVIAMLPPVGHTAERIDQPAPAP